MNRVVLDFHLLRFGYTTVCYSIPVILSVSILLKPLINENYMTQTVKCSSFFIVVRIFRFEFRMPSIAKSTIISFFIQIVYPNGTFVLCEEIKQLT